MAETALEQNEKRFAKKEAVSVSDVADAYTQTMEGLQKDHAKVGGKPENFEKDKKTK